MKRLLLICLLPTAYCLLNIASAQGTKERKITHYTYFELGGTGGVGSFNYERIFAYREKTRFSWRLGLCGLPIDKNNGVSIIFPAAVNAISGKGKHLLETGIGMGTTVTTKGAFFSLITPIIGYRYENFPKRLFFRVTYTPLVSLWYAPQYQHWAGISIGWRLKGLNECGSCLK